LRIAWHRSGSILISAYIIGGAWTMMYDRVR